MERKLKIMGIYVGMLFFISILLILITSLTNTKIDPSYELENVEEQYQVNFDKTMEQNVNNLTEHNRLLTERNIYLNEQLEEKNKIIEYYEKKYNQDVVNLQNAISLYIGDDKTAAKNTLENVNRENLNPENQSVYDNLLNKLN